ncbi:MAG: molecular chaperone HtpG [Legionellales bacterium]|nr:molecular chaperone HtpG [Legionellales bacterium]
MSEKQTLGFQTEVKQLLQLMIHSLYSNSEIFLRELISNASDAADKLRFLSLENSQLLEDDSELAIQIDIDKDAKTLTIRDNGIGMSRDDVISQLGTIAKSGTKEFLQTLTGDQAKDANLIGQFGVGFYSAFIVADKVVVHTRKAGCDKGEAIAWESRGEGDYTIETITKDQRGTDVILHLRDDAKEFLEEWRIRNIISKYSDHIGLPIKMRKMEDSQEDSEKDSTPATVEYEVVNRATALWTLSRNDIQEKDYQEFYKHIAHDFEDPLSWSHNRVEGKQHYISLLYIPKRAPFDLWNRDKAHGLKLYVQRVFIMDDAEQFLPMYLRFVKGIVDSSDLPLNISREILQNSPMVETIRKGCVSKILSMLEKIAENDAEKYQTFWNAFGNVLKEGPGEDYANRDRIAKLLRFATTHKNTPVQDVSLTEYVSRLKEGQDKIYYITAENFSAASNSPHLEIFRQKDIEVILLSDRVDEWLISHLAEFEGKQFVSVTKGNLDLGTIEDEATKEEHKKAEDEFANLVEKVKTTLTERVKDVRVTHRLTDSPACIVVDEHEMSSQLQRLMREAGQALPESKPILEINPKHPLVLRLRDENNQQHFTNLAEVLLDQAILAEGGHLPDPANFVKKLNGLLLEVA